MEITNIIKKKFGDSKALYSSGLSNLSLDKFEDAYYDFEKLCFAQPEVIDYWYYKALSLLGLEKFADALADFEYVINSNYHHSELFFYVGYIKFRMKDYSNAIKFFDKSSETGHKRFYRAISQYALKNYSEAMNDFTNAITLFDNELSLDIPLGKMEKIKNDICFSHLSKGLIYLKLNEYDKANNDFEFVNKEMFNYWRFGVKKWGLF